MARFRITDPARFEPGPVVLLLNAERFEFEVGPALTFEDREDGLTAEDIFSALVDGGVKYEILGALSDEGEAADVGVASVASDALLRGDGADSLDGTLAGSDGADSVDGSAGADSVAADTAADTPAASDGADSIAAEGDAVAADTPAADAGADSLDGTTGADSIDGAAAA
jgi:hypothetical protein